MLSPACCRPTRWRACGIFSTIGGLSGPVTCKRRAALDHVRPIVTINKPYQGAGSRLRAAGPNPQIASIRALKRVVNATDVQTNARPAIVASSSLGVSCRFVSCHLRRAHRQDSLGNCTRRGQFATHPSRHLVQDQFIIPPCTTQFPRCTHNDASTNQGIFSAT